VKRFLWATIALSSACFSEVDLDGLPSKDGYQGWASMTTQGDAPPHSDDTRIIYMNDIALTYTGAGDYPLGSVLVKEILNDAGDDVSYIAVMRRIDREPDGGRLEGTSLGRRGGWLFTRAADATDTEIQGITCWDTCHVQAPFAGAFLDYGSLLDPPVPQ